MPPKRIILMYISEVSGHHSATLAIEKTLKQLQPDIEILNINAFNYTNPISEKVINRLYLSVIKTAPQIWDFLYDNQVVINRLAKIKDTIHKSNSKKLKNLFMKFNPDAIVCTQAFPCGMVADYKKTYNWDVPLFAVLTDYAPHSYWVYDTVDYYITPSEEVAERLVQKGVRADKIKPLGIPFDPKFNEPLNKKKLLQRMGLRSDIPIILLMGGGQGLGPIKKIIKSMKKIKKEVQEIIVTGINKKLYKSLKRSLKKSKNKILLLGYADNIHELMAVSDIIITKPGGITTAEALAKKIPMLIVNPIPGQEAKNTVFLTEKGAAIKVENPEEIHLIIEYLLDNPSKLKKMRELAVRISKPNASFDLAHLLLKET